MKSTAQLLQDYKDEKTLVIGPEHLRTGLEDFPSFKEWKLEYMKEYALTHDMDNPMSMEDAVAALEAELEADDDELIPDEDLKALAADTPETPEEENDMTEETTPAAEATEAPADTKPAAKPKRKPAAKKKVAAKKRPPSKAKEAEKVFAKLYPKVVEGKKARKDVIDEFVTKVGLTANGAATYYQKLKKAADAG